MRLLTAIVFILLPSAAAVAQDGSVLERLETETRALASTARAAVVSVEAPRTYGLNETSYEVALTLTRTAQLAAAGARLDGVLVGSPARLVLPYVSGDAPVTVHLSDDVSVKAKRLDGDADLGISVYALPDDVARDTKGLATDGSWARLRPGALALGIGASGQQSGLLGIVLIGDVDEQLGTLEIGGAGEGPALIGTDGKLIAIRAGGAGSAVALDPRIGVRYDASTGTVRGRVLGADGRVLETTSMPAAQWASPTQSFLLPAPAVHRVLQDIERHGRIRHGFLGIVLGDAVVEGAKTGVIAKSVLADSPAQAAGIVSGARILGYGGRAVATTAILSRALALRAPGETVRLTVLAPGAAESKEFAVKLADRSEAQESILDPSALGLSCVELSDSLRQFLGIGAETTGVVVQRVDGSSAAERAGIRRGDILTHAGGGSIKSTEELRAALAGSDRYFPVRGLRGNPPHPFQWNIRVPRKSGEPR